MMARDDIKAPFLKYDTLRDNAEAFLKKYHPGLEIPVPIEEIFEFHLEIDDIIPVKNMGKNFDLVGFLTHPVRNFYIDEFILERRENRYRFTIAHESAHIILHQEVFGLGSYNSIDDYIDFIASIPEDELRWIEIQANNFAGLVLVPSEGLENRAMHYMSTLRATGIPIDSERKLAWDWVIENLARDFVVAPDTVRIRLEKDNLL